MLGRRLLLLVAVLLATGAIAAALTPRELRDSSTSPTTRTAPPPSVTSATGGTPAGAAEVTRTVDARGEGTVTVHAAQGDLLHLIVKVASPEEVELVGLGRFDSGDADTPARFDFFLDRRGSFPIHLQESGRDAGRLVVGAP